MQDSIDLLKKYLPSVFDYEKVRPAVIESPEETSLAKKRYVLPILYIPRRQEGYFDVSTIELEKDLDNLGFLVVHESLVYEDMERGKFVITKGEVEFTSRYFIAP